MAVRQLARAPFHGRRCIRQTTDCLARDKVQFGPWRHPICICTIGTRATRTNTCAGARAGFLFSGAVPLAKTLCLDPSTQSPDGPASGHARLPFAPWDAIDSNGSALADAPTGSERSLQWEDSMKSILAISGLLLPIGWSMANAADIRPNEKLN